MNMCWFCGGRCLLCGEPSLKVFQSLYYGIRMFACEEHEDEVVERARLEISRCEMREMALWN